MDSPSTFTSISCDIFSCSIEALSDKNFPDKFNLCNLDLKGLTGVGKKGVIYHPCRAFATILVAHSRRCAYWAEKDGEDGTLPEAVCRERRRLYFREDESMYIVLHRPFANCKMFIGYASRASYIKKTLEMCSHKSTIAQAASENGTLRCNSTSMPLSF